MYRTGLNWARSWLRRRRRSKEKAPLLARDDAVDARPVDTDLAEALGALSEDHRAVVVLIVVQVQVVRGVSYHPNLILLGIVV